MEPMLIRHLRRSVGFIWVALLFALVGLATITALGPRLGFTVYVIRGGSMAPAIPLGALVAAEPTDPNTLAVGDVVTLRAPNNAVYTHRIAAIDTSGAQRQFQVRGDANATPDAALVPASAVIGRVPAYAPILGYVSALLSMPSGLVSILSGLCALFLMYSLLEELEVGSRSLAFPSTSPQTAG